MDFIFPADQIAESISIPVSIAFDTDVSIDGLSNQAFQIKNSPGGRIWTSNAYVNDEASASDRNVAILNPGKRKDCSCIKLFNLYTYTSHLFEITCIF